MDNVRMGEMKISCDGELVALGLGSCIGLALVDTRAGVAGLAHIVLPDSQGREPAGKFADTGVPQLLAAVTAEGATKRRLIAVMIGGARMFATGMDVGARNIEAVHAALALARVPVYAEDTGGSSGRTARVHPAGEISTQSAGGDRRFLHRSAELLVRAA